MLLFGLALHLHFFRFRVFGVNPLSRNAGISALVGNHKLVPVAIAAGDRHLRNGFAVDGRCISGFDEKSFIHLDRHLAAVPVSQPRQESGVGFLRLVDMRDMNPGQSRGDTRRQLVARRDRRNNNAESFVVPGLLTPGIQRTAKISAAGANGQSLEPVGNIAADLHAAAPRVEIDFDNDAGANHIAQRARKFI